MIVGVVDVLPDRGFKLVDAGERSTTNAPFGQIAKPTFH